MEMLDNFQEYSFIVKTRDQNSVVVIFQNGNNNNTRHNNVKHNKYEHDIRGINTQPSFYQYISNNIQKYHEGQATYQ